MSYLVSESCLAGWMCLARVQGDVGVSGCCCEVASGHRIYTPTPHTTPQPSLGRDMEQPGAIRQRAMAQAVGMERLLLGRQLISWILEQSSFFHPRPPTPFFQRVTELRP